MKKLREIASNSWKAARRAIAAIGAAETILGLPEWVAPLKRRLSIGAAAVIAALAGLPWYLAMVLYLLVFGSFVFAGSAVVWAFKGSRYFAVREMARLLREAATRARELEKRNPWDEPTEPGVGIVQIENFVTRAFAYHVVADFEDYKRIMERKYGYSYFDRVADYLDDLAGRLTWRDIDYTFRTPDSFVDFDPWKT